MQNNDHLSLISFTQDYTKHIIVFKKHDLLELFPAAVKTKFYESHANISEFNISKELKLKILALKNKMNEMITSFKYISNYKKFNALC